MKVNFSAPTIFLFCACLTISCATYGPYNPYLDLKEKPSTTIQKDNQRMAKKAKRSGKRKAKKTKRYLYR